MVRLAAQKYSLALLLIILANCAAWGAEGDPVAIRFWPNNAVTIESHWNLKLSVISEATGQDSRSFDVDLQISTSRCQLRTATEGWSSAGSEYVLDRLPGMAAPTLALVSQAVEPSQNAIHVELLGRGAGIDGRDSGPCAAIVDVDGVRVLVFNTLSNALLEDASAEFAERGDRQTVDVIACFESSYAPSFNRRLLSLVQTTRPRIFAVGGNDLPDGLRMLLQSESSKVAVEDSPRSNTLAISQSEDGASSTSLIVVPQTAWEMPEELQALFEKKEQACRDSQAVFADLSVRQLNFQPSNGTHTPRWNAEHMMGRELHFFSQIYAELDAEIPVMDLNPAQMPPDYKAAHPDWDGEEEARQMERVTAFTRRFAYLLADLDLGATAPGSFWTPRALLKQMQRHYNEHTANVKKKFELPDWPR